MLETVVSASGPVELSTSTPRERERERSPRRVARRDTAKPTKGALAKITYHKRNAPENVDSDAAAIKAKKKGQLALEDVGISGSGPKTIRQERLVEGREGRQTTLNEIIERALVVKRGEGKGVAEPKPKRTKTAEEDKAEEATAPSGKKGIGVGSKKVDVPSVPVGNKGKRYSDEESRSCPR